MSVPPATRERPADAVAGLMAALALFGGALAFVYKPARIAPFAMLIALIAAAMSERHARLAAAALAVAGAGFVVGATIAVITNNPVF
ncbi:MAG: hypothetical protein M3R70_12835 [Actinomycetota bacterium]|nr:hypothetical protein [Actinomycetota bacterium]